MKNTIRSLFDEDLSLLMKPRPDDPDYCETVRRMLEREDALREQLSPSLEKELDALLSELHSVFQIETVHLQSEAFSLALRIAAEAFYDGKSIPSDHEALKKPDDPR